MKKKQISLIAVLLTSGLLTLTGLYYTSINMKKYDSHLKLLKKSENEFKNKIAQKGIVRILQKDSDLDTLKKYLDGNIAIEFSMNGCHYCKLLEPYFEKALEQQKGNVIGFYHSVDDNENITKYLISQGILKEKPDFYPTTIFIGGGKNIGALKGYNVSVPEKNQQDIEKMLDSLSKN